MARSLVIDMRTDSKLSYLLHSKDSGNSSILYGRMWFRSGECHDAVVTT
jgi:hypothetical protein